MPYEKKYIIWYDLNLMCWYCLDVLILTLRDCAIYRYNTILCEFLAIFFLFTFPPCPPHPFKHLSTTSSSSSSSTACSLEPPPTLTSSDTPVAKHTHTFFSLQRFLSNFTSSLPMNHSISCSFFFHSPILFCPPRQHRDGSHRGLL